LKNPNLKAKVFDNSAYNKWLKNPENENLKPMLNALSLRKEIGDNWGQIASNSHLSEFFEKIDKNQSLFYANQMYRKANELNSPEDKLEALKKLMRLENGEKLKSLSIQYTNLNDSILQVQNAVKDHFAKIRFDSERNRKENQLLRAETAQQELELEKRKLWMAISAALIILISVAVYAFFRIQKIRHQKLIDEEIYATEAKIAGKIHDDLANNIYRIMSKVENSNELELSKDKDQILDRLDKVYQLARNISRENAPVITGVQFPEELLSLISAYKNDDIKIILMGFSDFDWKKFSEEKQIQFYKSLQEILTNMKKHSRAKLVVLSFKEEKNHFEFFYTDNGIGMNPDERKEKNGMAITENRIVKIKGKFSFVSEPEKGLKIKISIPL
jgi:signal transduction histidine kinase